MAVYSNITNFMNKEGITYKDRLVLQVLLLVVRKGYEVVLFICKEGEYIRVDSKLLAEYFFTKKIECKNVYVSQEQINIEKINEEDIYFEVDMLMDENVNWENYYAQLEKRNCEMYSYLYFDNEVSEKDEQISERLQKQCKYMNTIFVADKEIEEVLRKKSKKCLAKVEKLQLNSFASDFVNEPFLQIEKGMVQIIKERNYIVCLFDCDNPRTNRGCMNEIRKKYPDKKIVYVVPSIVELDKYAKNKELGKSLFVIAGIDYYTLLNLYASALVVVVPRYCKSCGLEVINIQKVNGKCLFL